jgi:hypothetical protein
MGYNFNTITKEQEQAAKVKFNEYNAGLIMGKFLSGNGHSANATRYADLINTTLFGMRDLTESLRDLGRKVNNLVQDDILGDTDVMFSVKNSRDESVTFTYLEAYAFLRGVIRERQEAQDFKAKKQRLAQLETLVEGSKSVKERRKDAQGELDLLRQEMGLAPATTVQEAEPTPATT